MAVSTTPQFFAGMLAVGRNPDWEHVARAIDLLRASGVNLVTEPAVPHPAGGLGVPFFTRVGGLEALVGEGDPKARIEALSPYKLVAYNKLDPKTAGSFALGELAKLSDDNLREGRTRARDLEPRRPAPAGADASRVFEGLVGLDAQCAQLEKVANLVARRGRGALECLHMAFVGAPGTGKTELARRLLAYFDATGVTDGGGTFVKVGAADLVANYAGQTPSKTRAAVERALGGVLFVDEAYALADCSGYGQEAIDTLVDLLEAERDRLVCVIAGYPDQVERLFAANPGLRDRFGFRVRFDDYGVSELARIFEGFAQAHGFSVDPGAAPALEHVLSQMRGQRDFANARSARRLFDRAAMETAARGDGSLIEARDIEAAWAQPDMGGAHRETPVGFAR